MSSRDQRLRSDTRNLSGTHGNVFGNPRAGIDSSQTPYQGILHSWNQSATGGNPVRESTGRPVAKKWKNNSQAQFHCRVVQEDHQPWILSFHQKDHRILGWSAKIANLGGSFQKIPHTFNAFLLEDKIQNPNTCLFRFSLGGSVKDQRSGDGRFGGRFEIIALDSGLYSFP